MTRMAPSSTSLSASIAAADADADEQPTNVNYGAAAVAMAMAREDEPLLYNIPDGVHATYRPLPWLVQLGTILGSGFLSVITTWNHITWMHPIVALQSRKVNVLTLVKFLVKVRSFVGDLEKQFYVSHFLFVIIIIQTLAMTLLSQFILQDLFLPPSRLSMNTLRQNYFLPSQLSKYEPVAVSDMNKPMGVHYLQYQNKDILSSNKNTLAVFDALYVNHGFGASSLSWLPVLPSLTRRCKARIGLGHDTPGFGFTERPDDIESYQSSSSAAIGTQLLLLAAQKKKSSTTTGSSSSTNPSSKTVALVGHSMGCTTTLHMALQLPKETKKFIILCAPALGLGLAGKSNTNSLSGNKSLPREASVVKRAILQPLSSFGNRFLLTPIFGYFLRRLVG
jgi:pimeloyl-ACP methyl ester carboxylesterase